MNIYQAAVILASNVATLHLVCVSASFKLHLAVIEPFKVETNLLIFQLREALALQNYSVPLLQIILSDLVSNQEFDLTKNNARFVMCIAC